MRTFFSEYWYIGAIFSALYTLAGAWWSIQAERRLRALRRETAQIWKSVGGLTGKMYDIETYLEGTPTAHFKKAPRLIILPPPPNAS